MYWKLNKALFCSLIEVGAEDIGDWIQDEPRLTVQRDSRLRSEGSIYFDHGSVALYIYFIKFRSSGKILVEC